MKSKISRILGVGLMVAMLASMLVVGTGTPVSAAGYNSWSAEITPTSLNNVIGPGTNDIVDMAVAADGLTIYAVCGTTDTDSATTGIQLGMFKSLDGGATWARLTTLPTTIGTTITKVAVAPDSADGSVVAIIADTNEVYLSTNGGSVWTALADLNPVQGAVGAPTAAASLNCIDISRTVGITRTLAVGGTNNSTVAKAGVWYIEIGALVSRWVDATDNLTTLGANGWAITNFGASEAVWALKFSPTNFPGDRTMAVVTGPTGVTSNVTVALQVANFVTKVWNSGIIGFTGWASGQTIDTITAGTAVQSASLALAPTYLGQDAASRLVYVGLATGDTATIPRVGGVYRFTDTTKYELLSLTKIQSVAVNAAGDKLVAGAYATNYVYRLASPATAVSTSLLASSLYKSPSGVEKVVVAWMGTSVIAGTSGLNSAFSVSKDDGKSFNGISLVDNNGANTVLNPIPTLKDFTIATDGTKVYLVTLDAGSAYVSLWKKVTAWERVLVTNLALDFIVRAAPENFDVVYITGYAANTMLYSNDGGNTTWLPRYFAYTPVDMAVESASIVYILTGATVSKSIDSGLIWDGGLLPTTIYSGFTGATLTFVSAGNLLVGSTNGRVAYTTNSNVSWTLLVPVSTAAAIPSATAFATADKLSSGGYIYMAVASTTSYVYRWNIGVSTSWTSMRSAASYIYPATGIAFSNGVLYVVGVTGADTRLYRTLYPTTTTSDTFWAYQPASTSGINANMTFNDTPQALQVGAAGKLWAIDTDSSQMLETYGEYMSLYGPTLVAPAIGSEQPIDIATGRAQPINFQFKQLVAALRYQLQIATDITFAAPVFDTGAIDDTSVTAVKNWMIGPNVVAATPLTGQYYAVYEFLPDTTYYWRVRAASGVYATVVFNVDSPWSVVYSFKMGGIAVAGVTSPAKGANNVPVTPTFVWTEAKGAVLYELEVSTDETFATTDLAVTPAKAYYQTADADALAYDTTYYWRVRVATTGTWVYGVFTTMAEPTTPAPLITITQPPETTIQVELPPPVEAVPGYLLWIIIAIGAVLVIALIVLIVRTRRAA